MERLPSNSTLCLIWGVYIMHHKTMIFCIITCSISLITVFMNVHSNIHLAGLYISERTIKIACKILLRGTIFFITRRKELKPTAYRPPRSIKTMATTKRVTTGWGAQEGRQGSFGDLVMWFRFILFYFNNDYLEALFLANFFHFQAYTLLQLTVLRLLHLAWRRFNESFLYVKSAFFF